MAEPRPAPFLIGDDLALDFLNSVAAPWGREIEWLANGGDLVAWLERARAVPASVSAHFRAQAGSRPLDAVASQARELREWFRRFVRKHAGKPLGGGLCTTWHRSTSCLGEMRPIARSRFQPRARGEGAMAWDFKHCVGNPSVAGTVPNHS